MWVATHRKHHQFADKDGDPHSPRDGMWWSYAGWILMGNSYRQDFTTLKRYVPDLAEDKFYVWLTKWHLTPTIILGSCCSRLVDSDWCVALRREMGQATIGGWRC